jgi:hypothetical protein
MKCLKLAFLASLALCVGGTALAQSFAHVAPPRGAQSQDR